MYLATGKLDDGVDYLAVLLKFHPLCYLHVFAFGMVLARLRSLVASQCAAGAPPRGAAAALAALSMLDCR